MIQCMHNTNQHNTLATKTNTLLQCNMKQCQTTGCKTEPPLHITQKESKKISRHHSNI